MKLVLAMPAQNDPGHPLSDVFLIGVFSAFMMLQGLYRTDTSLSERVFIRANKKPAYLTINNG